MVKVGFLKVYDVVGTVSPGNAFVNGGANTVHDKIKTFLDAFIGVVIIVAVAAIIYYGLQFILADGDSNQVSKAVKGIVYSVAGLGIALAAGLVVQFVVGLIKGS